MLRYKLMSFAFFLRRFIQLLWCYDSFCNCYFWLVLSWSFLESFYGNIFSTFLEFFFLRQNIKTNNPVLLSLIWYSNNRSLYLIILYHLTRIFLPFVQWFSCTCVGSQKSPLLNISGYRWYLIKSHRCLGILKCPVYTLIFVTKTCLLQLHTVDLGHVANTGSKI